ncbi:MAG: hypothetical protein IIZ93_07845 [Acidaminococcaceae bacterium]|nr:hypothetical protein [Acidaminococcaceae bacterium]
MNYKDCIIVTKENRGIALRATKLTVQNNDQVIVIYDDEDIMGIFSMSEIKAVIFADLGDGQMAQSMIDAIIK